jgi:hypothetical protein
MSWTVANCFMLYIWEALIHFSSLVAESVRDICGVTTQNSKGHHINTTSTVRIQDYNHRPITGSMQIRINVNVKRNSVSTKSIALQSLIYKGPAPFIKNIRPLYHLCRARQFYRALSFTSVRFWNITAHKSSAVSYSSSKGTIFSWEQ